MRQMMRFLLRSALKVMALTFFLAAIGIIGLILIGWNYGRDLPDHEQLAAYEPNVVTRVYAGNGALLAEFAIEKRIFVPTTSIPKPVIQAFLSAEDKDFYRHFGLDAKALIRAVSTNIINLGTGRRPVGASTITQQVAKNFLLTNELSYRRKIKEAILAIRMERAFTKEQILELYLNEIYLGFGSYGVAAAALNYFDKPLDALTLAEIAYLAALPKAPNNYHPTRKRKAAIGRRNWVLQQMVENDFISEDEAKRASGEPINLRSRSAGDGAEAPFFTEEVRREIAKTFGQDQLYRGGLAVRTSLDPSLQLIAEESLTSGLESLDKRQGWRGSLGWIDDANTADSDAIIKTLAAYQSMMLTERKPAMVVSVKPSTAAILVLSEAGDDLIDGIIPFALADWAYPPRRRDGTRPPPITSLREALKVGDIIMVQRPETVPDRVKRHKDLVITDKIWALGQIPLVQGALVALDPHTGRVLAMTGGYNPRQTQFNRATQARRQPGSSFKPFVYLAALDNGYSPITLILDAPLAVDQGPGLPKWKPANYTKRFYGPSIMRLGIEQSRNLMTARLAMTLGMPVVQDYAKRFGVDDDMPSLWSMSLGAGETTLLRLTAAYGMIVNGGFYIEPTMIDRVQNRYGKTVYRHDKRGCAGCSLTELSDDGTLLNPPPFADIRPRITDQASAYQMVTMLEGVVRRGTARSMKDISFAVAGKTGTTNDNTNGWFVGFSPDLVVGVYIGFDQPKPLGRAETGSTTAVPVFANFITDALADTPSVPFRRPDGVNLYTINFKTGVRAQLGESDAVLEAFKPGQRPFSPDSASSVIDVPGQNTATISRTVPGLY